MSLGLYVHFPYCLRLCPYCDFAVSVKREVPEQRYADAILTEWRGRLEGVPEGPLTSVYFGGGTPSLWHPRYIEQLLEGVSIVRPLADNAEVTLEANPERLSGDWLAGYRAAGVNRLSFGAQSFSTHILRALGRAHRSEEVEAGFDQARRAGFENVSLDLIYGVHGQTREEAALDARRAVELAPEHLSAYALTLDAETLAVPVVLSRRLAKGEIELPVDEDVIAMADQLAETCEAAGLAQYEISNFAKPGMRSRHNQLYWRGDDCVALGAGAVGLLAGPDQRASRYTNLRDADAYLTALEQGRLPEQEREALDPRARLRERVMTGLRLVEGTELQRLFVEACEPWGRRDETLQRLAGDGLVRRDGLRVVLTRKGRHLHSSIATELIP